uniref:cGMP-dependent protein kinase interacting domain-containing protein n=1 Tax=Photinus pyralis TaxID=7054 RepID=A0A1Y1JWN0_PHOPY
MSFRNTPSARQRSSSLVRFGSTGNVGYGRPRSLGFFNANKFSPYATSQTSNFSPYSSVNNNYSPSYSSNYKSPYFSNDYRGRNGYASLTIPVKAFSPTSVVPNYAKLFDNTHVKSARQSRPTTRSDSFNRKRSLSSVSSGMGSRSLSLTSLNSEGYASGTDRSNRSSRLGSTTDIRGENGEIDYKKLYEQAILENDRLRDKLKKSDEELRDTKQTLERLNTVTSKNSLSELEKREKRAMERKLSEMEEELKQLEILKSENQRLKDENGALIRVISKLSK